MWRWCRHMAFRWCRCRFPKWRSDWRKPRWRRARCRRGRGGSPRHPAMGAEKRLLPLRLWRLRPKNNRLDRVGWTHPDPDTFSWLTRRFNYTDYTGWEVPTLFVYGSAAPYSQSCWSWSTRLIPPHKRQNSRRDTFIKRIEFRHSKNLVITL